MTYKDLCYSVAYRDHKSSVIMHSALSKEESNIPKEYQLKDKKYSSKDITATWGDGEFYYLKLKTDDDYDNTVIRVDKKTFKVDTITFPEFLATYKGNELTHSGVSIVDGAPGRGSGRYPRGSGKNPRAEKLAKGVVKAHAIGSELANNSIVVNTAASLIRSSIMQAVLNSPAASLIFNPITVAAAEYTLNSGVHSKVNTERAAMHAGKPRDSEGCVKLEKKESIDELIENTNPYHGNALGNRNCWSCAYAAAMRQRGKDVVAKAVPIGIPSLYYLAGIQNKKKVTRILPAMNNYTDAANVKKRISEAYGNPKNAQGILTVRWAAGGGHAINWKIENGKCTIFDTQRKEKDLSFIDRYFYEVNRYTPMMLYRMDNAKLNTKAIRSFCNTI